VPTAVPESESTYTSGVNILRPNLLHIVRLLVAGIVFPLLQRDLRNHQAPREVIRWLVQSVDDSRLRKLRNSHRVMRQFERVFEQ